MFNPTAKTLAEISIKDLDKKSLQRLGKKANSELTALPFFIKTDHQYDPKTIAAIFLFGKIKQLKAEIKPLKGNNEQHGLAFLEYNENKESTLCLIPTKGKLLNRESVFKKVMRDTFGTKWANFRILAAISEKEAEAMEEKAEAAAEAMEEDEDIADEPTTANTPEKEEKPTGATAKQVEQLTNKLLEINTQLEDLVKKTNILMSLDALYLKIETAEQGLLHYAKIMQDLFIQIGSPVVELEKAKAKILNLRKNAKNIVDIAELDPNIPEEWPDDLEFPLKAQNELKNKIERAIENNPLEDKLLPALATVEKNLKAIYSKAKAINDTKIQIQILKTIEEELKKLLILKQEVEREQAIAIKNIPAELTSQVADHLQTLRNLLPKLKIEKLVQL
jgi:predicted RNA-binding protein with RPS1 domain